MTDDLRERVWWIPLVVMGMILARSSAVAAGWYLTVLVSVSLLDPLFPNRQPGRLGLAVGIGLSLLAVYLDKVGVVSFT